MLLSVVGETDQGQRAVVKSKDQLREVIDKS